MLQSQLFCKTKKEASKEAEIISHKYLLRGDFIEQSFSGVYRFLPLGLKVLKKIEIIIREEMRFLGAQELYLPTLQNKTLWMETNRWKTFDPPLFKFKDRHQKEIALGSTHEEEITDSFRRRIKSYQDLPLYLFQIQDKFRNEMRPTSGLLRTREFLMKDLYSFNANKKNLLKFYEKVKKSYFKIFKKCGLKPLCVEANSGTIGGKLSHEFTVLSEYGEDKVLICQKCGFAANIEKIGNIKKCPKCKGNLIKRNAIEIGHIFALGTKYSKVMKASFRNKEGKIIPVMMGCYGIGLSRLMATIVESNHDKEGIIWPKTVAPFDIHLLALSSNKEIKENKIKKTAEKLYKNLQKRNVEVLYDDRENVSPGETFADCDLIGIPTRIVISEKTLNKDCLEIKQRNEKKIKLIKIKKYVQ